MLHSVVEYSTTKSVNPESNAKKVRNTYSGPEIKKID